ncbi:MAG: chromate efflux transporter [Casimicrobiaceae bacterium]
MSQHGPPAPRSAPHVAAPSAPSRTEAFRYWLKLGFISFGGPAGQIAIMHRDLVDTKRWISEQRFLHALNYCMVLPGPEAQQLATYIGWLMHRTWGGVIAGGLFVLPSLLVLIAAAWIYMAFGSVPAVAGVLYGIKPAVVAIVAHAAWRIGSRTLGHPLLWIIAALAFVAIAGFHVPFPVIIATAALLGLAGARWVPAAFAGGAGHHAASAMHPPALIDDSTPSPPHARFRWRTLLGVLAACVGLWGGAVALLRWVAGDDGTLPDMAWFFTKAAFLTFGGAYAVLPYVVQGAVEGHGWLTATQMIDGLALGESTPGPLIMVVAFVGFVGGWTHAIAGDPLLLAGAAGACVATYFTFLPSFLFILAGAPLVESTHGRMGFTAPLTGITAAVTGVIANLAVYFGGHVLVPPPRAGLWHGLDPVALLLVVLAGVALARRIGVIPVIAACAAVGALVRLSGVLPA